MESFKDHSSEGPGVLEEGRRPTGGTPGTPAKPDPEVAPRPKRRYLTVAYKLKVLDTVAALPWSRDRERLEHIYDRKDCIILQSVPGRNFGIRGFLGHHGTVDERRTVMRL